MIKAGIDVDYQDIHGCAAIHRSAQHATSKVADLLIKSNANLNIHDSDVETPLDYARRYRNRAEFEEVLKMNGKKSGWSYIEDDTDVLLDAAKEGIISVHEAFE